jgi:hypothetical protein
MRGDYATVEKLRPWVWKVCSVASLPFWPALPTMFLDVLWGWGHTWLWNETKVVGGTDWLSQAIAGKMLIAVTDGSYIWEHYPEICFAAFILKCKHSGGQITGAFPEALIEANAFQGELLGLMAVHLLLLAMNTVSPGLTGLVRVCSDCLGALSRVAELPPYQVLTCCRHSDILKTILVNCGGLTFSRKYCHVEAHQDDKVRWEELSHEAQLYAACNAGAKAMIQKQDITDLPQQKLFPLELICMFVEGKKMASDTGPHI